MGLKDFLEQTKADVSTVLASDFEVEVTETNKVPNFDDPAITYDNLDTKIKRVKRLESCVLYVDIRDSAKFSAEKRPKTLAKTYSTFVKSMIGCARYHGGHVRNIIGDRVMVVFDKEECFKNAVNTAVLMNSVAKYILNPLIRSTDFQVGIGIDYGPMLITKAGQTRHGAEREFYRSLVWLGKPANVASRLTDVANKKIQFTEHGVSEGIYFPATNVWHWRPPITCRQFVDSLSPTYSRKLLHEDEYFCTFIKSMVIRAHPAPPRILMTEAVYNGVCKEDPECNAVKYGYWKKVELDVKDVGTDVYGGDVHFTAVNEI